MNIHLLVGRVLALARVQGPLPVVRWPVRSWRHDAVMQTLVATQGSPPARDS